MSGAAGRAAGTGTDRLLVIAGAVLGLLAVAAGAFGAHALRDEVPAERLAAFETGARYQMYHALAILLAIVLARSGAAHAGRARTAAVLFAAGCVVFSGSLYALTLTGVRAFGAITPLGGAGFLAGWALLALAAGRRGNMRDGAD